LSFGHRQTSQQCIWLDLRKMARVSAATLYERFRSYAEQMPDDGRPWCPWDNGNAVDLPPEEEVMEFRGEGGFAYVKSFERFNGREGLCIKVMKSRITDNASDYKDQSDRMMAGEILALITSEEASIPGVVRLKAITEWRGSHAIVLDDHGTLTLSRALRDGILSITQKDDIIGQLVQTIVGLSSADLAHFDITPRNIML
ncbi:unnamed protein product, partial [Scytosiphon promiscuus]